jgi:O-antigen/teichoic acid export membrane protein
MSAQNILWLNYICPGRVFFVPTLLGISKVFKFGSLTSLTSIISEFGSGAPDLILGRTLGFVEVAFFSRAYGLKKMLVTTLFRIVRTVYFPTFAKEIRDGKKTADLYSESMVYIVAVMGPMLAFMGVVSEPLIIFLFGEQWGRSAPLASLICFYAVLSTPFSLYNVSLVASGKVVTNFVLEFTVQFVQIAVLLSSLWFDLELVVSLFILVSLAQVVGAYVALRREFSLSLLLHMKRIFSSIILIPISIAGPVFVIYSKSLFDAQIYILVCAGLLWILGWLLGVFLLKHPMANEVQKIVSFFLGSYAGFIKKYRLRKWL